MKFSFASLVAFIAFMTTMRTKPESQQRFGAHPTEIQMTQQILEPASKDEAEMAAVATTCLMAALDHSRAEHVRVKLQIDDGQGEPPIIELPPRVLRFLADVLKQMARQEPMVLVPHKAELTTQQAAAFLNVSRPFVIKEIEARRLDCRMVNRHRRIMFEELVRYQQAQKIRSAEALRAVSQASDEIGQEL
ncbi:helix-turn-helix domain-containing protein [Variovorax robiniae]|uniref:Helix-turn-helix domain-containing protein n=1 Tax=Variovorax robiniae TaxID=1836199 RepID=A0ABU8XDA8_9BURK